MQIWNQRKKPLSIKKHKINPFVTNWILKTNCKRSRKSVLRENFQLKLETQRKRTHSNKKGHYIHENMEVKREAVASFPFYIWAPGQRQACFGKKNIFSQLRRPQTLFRPAQGHQGAGASTSSNKIFQSTIIAVNGVEHQMRVNINKLGRRTEWFSEVLIVISSIMELTDPLEDTLR